MRSFGIDNKIEQMYKLNSIGAKCTYTRGRVESRKRKKRLYQGKRCNDTRSKQSEKDQSKLPPTRANLPVLWEGIETEPHFMAQRANLCESDRSGEQLGLSVCERAMRRCPNKLPLNGSGTGSPEISAIQPGIDYPDRVSTVLASPNGR